MSSEIRVLYVEDDPDIREVVEFCLEDEGYDLTICENGFDAIGKAGSVEVDLVLLDVMMPGIDGPTAMVKLRAMPHMKDVPVIFMTAKVQASEVKEYKKLGAIDVIMKPFDTMALPGMIRDILGR